MEFHLYSQNRRRDLPPALQNAKLNDPSLYVPSDGLIQAVNVALALGHPLLVTGEPGTGKTRLADHIAWIFNLDTPLVFNAQTTSSARDLFYHYDALGHFQYSQTQKQTLSPDEVETRFIRYQGLGQAIRENRRALVLIDEIDKAPRDLPNDVLAALEDLRFQVPETGKTYAASRENRPVIVLTSNSEKNLPDAFLRRVVYYHIPFPDAKALLEILKAKTEGLANADLEAVIDHFELLRSGRKVKLQKNPATAELIFWTLLLQKMKFPTVKLANIGDLGDEDRENLAVSYSVLAKTKEDLAALRQVIGRMG